MCGHRPTRRDSPIRVAPTRADSAGNQRARISPSSTPGSLSRSPRRWVHDGAVECKGYNGTIIAEGDHLIITHSGLVAKGGGLVVDQPRCIPLQAISGVELKAASRMTNGWLTVGLGGVAPPQLSAGTAASNADTVLFRHKSKDEFKALHDWLVTVLEHNQAEGIDPSTVEFDAAGETRTERIQAKADSAGERIQAKADSAGAKAKPSQTEKMTGLLGDERPDIVAAAARMGRRMGGKRELKKLAGHLHKGETVRFIAQGTYENDQGILVLTDLRLLFLFHGVMSQRKEDFPLRLITSVQTKSGMVTGEMKVFVSGNSSSISGIVKSDLEPLADAVRQGMATQHAAPPTAPPAATADDPYEALQKLASLRDAGVLTEDEFSAKKQDLLGRM